MARMQITPLPHSGDAALAPSLLILDSLSMDEVKQVQETIDAFAADDVDAFQARTGIAATLVFPFPVEVV